MGKEWAWFSYAHHVPKFFIQKIRISLKTVEMIMFSGTLTYRPPFPLQGLDVGDGVGQVFEVGRTRVMDSKVEGDRVSQTDWIVA